MIFSCFGPKNAHLKIPVGFLFTSWLISKQTADCQKNVEGIKWPAIDDERFGMHKISVLSMVTKLQDKRCFVNKQLTYNTNLIAALRDCMPQNKWDLLSKFPELYEKISILFWEISTFVVVVQAALDWPAETKVEISQK